MRHSFDGNTRFHLQGGEEGSLTRRVFRDHQSIKSQHTDRARGILHGAYFSKQWVKQVHRSETDAFGSICCRAEMDGFVCICTIAITPLVVRETKKNNKHVVDSRCSMRPHTTKRCKKTVQRYTVLVEPLKVSTNVNILSVKI